MKLSNSTYRVPLIIFILFTLIAVLISCVNHYLFRTFALDLGVYTNALYEYSHLRLPTTNSFSNETFYLLGDHFDIYLMLFSPFVYFFGSYTLLIIQILFLSFGAFGVYKYLNAFCTYRYISIAGMLYFLLFYGTIGVLGYDYHSNVIASCLVPWYFYSIHMNQKLRSWLVIILICIGRENMSLWMSFVCVGMFFINYKDQNKRKVILLHTVFTLMYTVIILGLVIPYLTKGHAMAGFKYSQFGNSPTEVISNIFKHPDTVFEALFANLSSFGKFDFIKVELHFFLLISGLYVLIKSPFYFIMLVPIYFQKLLHDNSIMWGVGRHYSIEFAPILAIGIFSTISNIQNVNGQRILSILVGTGALVASLRLMDNTVAYVDKVNLRFYQGQHYQSKMDVKMIYSEIRKIPQNSIVSAQSNFFPHLALRKSVYQFPIIKDSEYIVVNHYGPHYPLKQKQFKSLIDSLEGSSKWVAIIDDPSILIFKRK